MDDDLSFDVYALITDPPWRVEHEALDSRVSVVIGGPPNEPPPINLLQLWFKDPGTVVSLGRELMTAGRKLAAQLGGTMSDAADSCRDSCEEPPVPAMKPSIVESGDER